MIHSIPDVLTNEDVTRIRTYLTDAQFLDGRTTNRSSPVKKNEQLDLEDAGAIELAEMIVERMRNNPRLSRIAFPRNILRPMFSRYRPEMAYGPHLDEALMPAQPTPMRTDLSCTVFLSAPDDYQGGELEIWMGNQRAVLKEPAGHAVLYPTGVIHQVRPVTTGVRFAAVTWIQSYIPGQTERHTLGHYYQLVERLAPKATTEEQLLMESVRTNLFRMWVDP